ncbi:CAP domain-containing protein, partial [bacterium]|nr:CAP domain-containing protein [bacterium]
MARIYGGEEDAIDHIEANRLLLGLLNEERRAQGFLPPLQDHPLASRLAQEHAAGMASGHYVSHYDLAGRKCELRFNAIGESDHVSENTAYYEIKHPVFLTPQLVRRMHMHWLESDSHRDNLLDPAHTHAGSGFAVTRSGQRTYAAGVVEFVNDYGGYDRLPERTKAGSTLHLSGYLDPGRATLQYVGLASEDLPFARDAEYQMSHISGYSPPDVVLAMLPRQYAGLFEPDIHYTRYTVEYDEDSGHFSVDIPL